MLRSKRLLALAAFYVNLVQPCLPYAHRRRRPLSKSRTVPWAMHAFEFRVLLSNLCDVGGPAVLGCSLSSGEPGLLEHPVVLGCTALPPFHPRHVCGGAGNAPTCPRASMRASMHSYNLHHLAGRADRKSSPKVAKLGDGRELR